MVIETKDGRKVKITKPAGINDTPKVVSAIFNVNDRDKEKELSSNKKAKTKTTIIGGNERQVLSTDLVAGMAIKAVDGAIKNRDNSKSKGVSR